MRNKEENPNKEHRKRMRTKFAVSRFSGMADHEILEFLLFFSIPVKDTKHTARTLLKKFLTLEGVFQADMEELESTEGIGEISAMHITAISELMSEIKKRALREKMTFSTAKVAYDYLVDFFINERTEKLYAIFLDKGDRVLNTKLICDGGIDNMQIDAGAVVREAVLQKCVSVVLVHNHPGGHTEASDADIALTLKIAQALQFVDVNIKDHIIITGDNYYSMREQEKLF